MASERSAIEPPPISHADDLTRAPERAASLRRLLDATSPGTGLRTAWVAVAFLLAAAAVIAIILAVLADEIRREWLIGAGLGLLLLTVAGVFDAVLLARSRRPLDVAHRALRVAADDLATSYAALAEAHRELGITAEARDRALGSLRAAVREREAFLTSISHDLNTPLTVIRGKAQVLRGRTERAGTVEPQQVIKVLASIDDNAGQMEALLSELLDLARLELGEAPALDPRPTDLVALTRSLVQSHADATDRHTFRFEASAPSLIGSVDVAGIGRVLGNLLENAVKYSPTGGTIDVRVAGSSERGLVELVVRDHGIGIPPDDLPRVFERFYRASNADVVDGSGLGLAGVRHIVEAHGGEIGVSSEPGEGSTFTVRLPLGRAAVPAQPGRT